MVATCGVIRLNCAVRLSVEPVGITSSFSALMMSVGAVIRGALSAELYLSFIMICMGNMG